jgi:hypothetical protein
MAITEHARLRIDAARDALLASHGRTSIIADEVVLALLVDLRYFCTARRIEFDNVNRLAAVMFDREGRRS